MTKKEYILAVIDTFPDWEMWWWLKAMVQNDQLDERTINILVIILNNAMDKITAAVKESKLIERIDNRVCCGVLILVKRRKSDQIRRQIQGDTAEINIASLTVRSVSITPAHAKEHDAGAETGIGPEEIIFRCVQ